MSGFPCKLLYLVTEDWYFCSHRLELAQAARRAGYDVVVATTVGRHSEQIISAGLRLVPLVFPRGFSRPLQDIALLFHLCRLYKAERPDLVHHIALKPILYGCLAARWSGLSVRTVNSIAGLGYLSVATTTFGRLLKRLVSRALRALFSRHDAVVIVQNPEDQRSLLDGRLAKLQQIRLIRGAGVNLTQFVPSRIPNGTPLVMMASRMLWSKGVGIFVDAVQLLLEKEIRARFALVGDPDSSNPDSVPQAQLEVWREKGIVEWWGHRDDMEAVLTQASVVCLPTYYGEGLPKVLLEAAACARPIVATDVPGCREIARHGVNALVVPPRDARAVAMAVETLLGDAELRSSFGARGREIVSKEFTVERVIQETLDLYRDLLDIVPAA